MPQYVINVEESSSEALMKLGIIVVQVKGTSLRYYARAKATHKKDYPFELEFLSLADLKRLGIQIEETVAQQNNDPTLDVEESAQGEGDKKHVDADLTKPEDREKLRKILEKSEKVFGDSELAEENKDLKEKIGMIAQVAFEKKKEQLGCNDPAINTPEQLMAWEKGQESTRPEATGSAPLNDAQYGRTQQGSEDFLKKPYSSTQEMVEAVRAMARNPSDPNQLKAQHVLDQWLKNWETAKRENPSKPDEFPNPNSQEEMQKLQLIEQNGMLVSSDKDFDSFGLKRKFLDKHPDVKRARQQIEGGQ